MFKMYFCYSFSLSRILVSGPLKFPFGALPMAHCFTIHGAGWHIGIIFNVITLYLFWEWDPTTSPHKQKIVHCMPYIHCFYWRSYRIDIKNCFVKAIIVSCTLMAPAEWYIAELFSLEIGLIRLYHGCQLTLCVPEVTIVCSINSVSCHKHELLDCQQCILVKYHSTPLAFK